MLDGREHDAVTALSGPLPVMVIAELLGIPADDHETFKRWSDRVVGAFGLVDQPEQELEPEQGEPVVEALGEMYAYFTALFEDRQRAPRDDLVTRLLAASEDGDELSADEVWWFCLMLLIAGNETTTNLIGNMLIAFAEHPGEWRLLKEQPGLVRPAVEEALRYDPPILGLFRTARRPFPVGDEEVPLDARVLLLFAAANRDPARYDSPERFSIGRNPTDHMAFGNGIHFCLGATLARTEARAVLEALLRSARSVEITGEVERMPNPTVRGPACLPLRLQPA
jgi:cytochrome P450